MTDLKKLMERLQEKIDNGCHPPALSCQEEKILFRAAKEGDKQAKDLFVRCNRGLVFIIARVSFRLMPSNAKSVIGFSDVLQDGDEGLTKAMEKFEPERGNKFSTYAVWWIRQAIEKAIKDRCREIRIPHHFQKKQAAIVSAVASFYERCDREPTLDEIAAETSLKLEDVEIALRPGLKLLPLSLNAMANDDKRTELGDLLGKEENFDEAIALEEIKEEVRKVLATLSPRQEFILRLRFGVNGDGDQEPKTLDQTAEALAEKENKTRVSRERIRQIEEKAKEKIRRRKRALEGLARN